ncbi:MAG: DUF1844 domain-containing protein [Planctomycetota bacterium]|nr:DUF1844 domain-containing protein [Planctomycetota bacterium]
MTEETNREIRIDAAWKEEVRRERERLKQQEEEERKRREAEARDREGAGPAETDRHFLALVQSLAAQALMQLGQMENPLSGARELDLHGAKQTIDILGALQRKTKGNLSAQEQEMLEGALADLRLIYVERAGGARRAPGGQGRQGGGRQPGR